MFIAADGDAASLDALMSAALPAVVAVVMSLVAMPASAAPVDGAALSAVVPIVLPALGAAVPSIVLWVVVSMASGWVLMVLEVSAGAGLAGSIVAWAIAAPGIIIAAAARSIILRIVSLHIQLL